MADDSSKVHSFSLKDSILSLRVFNTSGDLIFPLFDILSWVIIMFVGILFL